MKLILLMLKLGTWPQKVHTMAKCEVHTYTNMHKHKLGSNSPQALRTEPGG